MMAQASMRPYVVRLERRVGWYFISIHLQ